MVIRYETVDAKRREQLVKDFFAGTIDRAQVLRDNAVTYIVVGPRERKLGVIDFTQLAGGRSVFRAEMWWSIE